MAVSEAIVDVPLALEPCGAVRGEFDYNLDFWSYKELIIQVTSITGIGIFQPTTMQFKESEE